MKRGKLFKKLFISIMLEHCQLRIAHYTLISSSWVSASPLIWRVLTLSRSPTVSSSCFFFRFSYSCDALQIYHSISHFFSSQTCSIPWKRFLWVFRTSPSSSVSRCGSSCIARSACSRPKIAQFKCKVYLVRGDTRNLRKYPEKNRHNTNFTTTYYPFLLYFYSSNFCLFEHLTVANVFTLADFSKRDSQAVSKKKKKCYMLRWKEHVFFWSLEKIHFLLLVESSELRFREVVCSLEHEKRKKK